MGSCLWKANTSDDDLNDNLSFPRSSLLFPIHHRKKGLFPYSPFLWQIEEGKKKKKSWGIVNNHRGEERASQITAFPSTIFWMKQDLKIKKKTQTPTPRSTVLCYRDLCSNKLPWSCYLPQPIIWEVKTDFVSSFPLTAPQSCVWLEP